MRSMEQIPIILTNQQRDQNHFEGDCACPIPPARPRSVDPSPNAVWQIAPTLYRAELPEEHELAFNYLGDESLAVLNRPARTILDFFQSPAALHHTADGRLHKIESEIFSRAVQEMIHAGLLVQPQERPYRPAAGPETLTVWIHVTNQCNLACDYCYLNKTSDAMDLELGRNAVDAVFRSAIAHGFKGVKLKYAGGEATLNFSLVVELHRYAVSRASATGLGLEGVVLSNGIGLSLTMIRTLKENGLRLSLSLDGIGQANDIQRHFINGRGSFASLERTLDRLRQADFLPTITVTISARNASHLPETVRYLQTHRLPFTLNFYRENECSSGFEDLRYANEQIVHYAKQAFRLLEQDLPPYSLLGSLVDRARLDGSHDRPCGVGSSYFVIDQQGGVAKCHMEIEKTITSVSAEDPLAFIRLDQLGLQNPSVDEKQGCRECEWRYWCSGGCPALTYRATGRFDVKSPNCSIYKALLPEVLRLEGLRLLKYGAPAHLL